MNAACAHVTVIQCYSRLDPSSVSSVRNILSFPPTISGLEWRPQYQHQHLHFSHASYPVHDDRHPSVLKLLTDSCSFCLPRFLASTPCPCSLQLNTVGNWDYLTCSPLRFHLPSYHAQWNPDKICPQTAMQPPGIPGFLSNISFHVLFSHSR